MRSLIIQTYKNNPKARPATVAAIVRDAGYNIGSTIVSDVVKKWKERSSHTSSIMDKIRMNQTMGDTLDIPTPGPSVPNIAKTSHYSAYTPDKPPEDDLSPIVPRKSGGERIRHSSRIY